MAFSPEELQVAPNGTDPERYQGLPQPEEARRQLGLPQVFTVGYTGHFYPGRGMNLLTGVAKNNPGIHFLWVGGREKDIQPWRETLAAESIDNVTITGFIPNARLPLYQAAADILAMPYAKKIAGSSGGNIAPVINPMKMFDYISAGRPIIASNIPVFHEVLTNQIALFCDPYDVGEWSAAIEKLKNDTNLRRSMSAASLAAADHYSWINRAKRSLSKLEKIIQ